MTLTLIILIFQLRRKAFSTWACKLKAAWQWILLHPSSGQDLAPSSAYLIRSACMSLAAVHRLTPGRTRQNTRTLLSGCPGWTTPHYRTRLPDRAPLGGSWYRPFLSICMSQKNTVNGSSSPLGQPSTSPKSHADALAAVAQRGHGRGPAAAQRFRLSRSTEATMVSNGVKNGIPIRVLTAGLCMIWI